MSLPTRPTRRATCRPEPKDSPTTRGSKCHGWLVGFTTYQLAREAQRLDAADGGRTTLSWCPDFLLLAGHRIKGYTLVAQALEPGVVYYEAHPELEPVMRSRFVLDPEDLQAARLILANPGAAVIGPNDLPEPEPPHELGR